MPARKPEECDLLFGDHVNAGDLEALVALYEPTCVLVQWDGTLLVGHDAIRANLARLIAMKAHMDIQVVKVVAAGRGTAPGASRPTIPSRAAGRRRDPRA